MFIVHSYNAVVQISEQVEKYEKKVPKQAIGVNCLHGAWNAGSCPAGQKIFQKN